MANTISYVEDFLQGQTETAAFHFFERFNSEDPDAKSIAEAKADLEAIMNEPQVEKRVEIANRIIKDGKSDLGIAYLVLARTSSELADKEKHYRAAQENSANHNYKGKTSDDFNVRSDMLHGAITLEFADLLWRASKREAAIEVLQKLQSHREELWLGQEISDCLVSSLGTYLICASKITEAHSVLEMEADPNAHWYYLNALVKFRERGDCIQSRSALSAALNDAPVVALNLTEPDELSDKENPFRDWDDYFSMIALPAWQETEGALPWLTKIFNTKHQLFGASEVPDEVRFKKFQREMELAEAHIRREDFKSLKKSFKTAMREADSLNDGGDMFLMTAKMLGTVLAEEGDSLEGLRESFDKKLAWLDRQESDDFESLFTSYSNFAKTLFELNMDKQAQRCAAKALELYEKSVERGTEKLDYFYACECLLIHSCLLSRGENFEEAERSFSKLVSMQEEFLGDKHLDLVGGLMGRRYCLHQLNRHDEEKAIFDRLFAMDPNFDADDELRFECEAVPAGSAKS